MATAKKVSSAPVKPTAPSKKVAAAKSDAPLKPIKTAFNKTSLGAHLAEQTGLEPKAAKAFMAALEATVLASVHKKGLGEFTLPGLMKVTAIQVAAKKKRIGIDPFTKVEREFAAKPATTKIKVRRLMSSHARPELFEQYLVDARSCSCSDSDIEHVGYL